LRSACPPRHRRFFSNALSVPAVPFAHRGPARQRQASRKIRFSHRHLPIYNRGLYNFVRNALAPKKFHAICPIFDAVTDHVVDLCDTMSPIEYHADELTDAFASKVTQQPCFFMEQAEPDHFAELLGVLDEEELIRFRHRLKKAGNLRTTEVLTDEIQKCADSRRHPRGKA
jgi:hypothetical protein